MLSPRLEIISCGIMFLLPQHCSNRREFEWGGSHYEHKVDEAWIIFIFISHRWPFHFLSCLSKSYKINCSNPFFGEKQWICFCRSKVAVYMHKKIVNTVIYTKKWSSLTFDFIYILHLPSDKFFFFLFYLCAKNMSFQISQPNL